ncbi:putative NmrA-like domain-containing protein [Seiridium unicorne]|uniref:NmrA-like domain-containing protein n=1 Tax=Seiridium unicorne TaxID=138068 RepID=A0ABR2UID1_9PEZI
MVVPIRNVALLGATGTLGTHIREALVKAGYAVTAIQRKSSGKAAPPGVRSIKVDLSNQDELISAFAGQDAVVSAVPNPALRTERIVIDAAIASSVKRFIPSEYSTNLETPLSRKLPIAKEKVQIREYLHSAIASSGSSLTWTSVNNGPFFEMCLEGGVLGPNIKKKKAVFHNGGDNVIGPSTLPDIAAAIVKIIDPAHLDETANQPVYIYSAAISERQLTRLAAEVTGINFGDVEGGRIADLDVDRMVKDAEDKFARGDNSGWFSYFFQMMYGKGYGGTEFRDLAWNNRLGLRVMDEADLRQLIQRIAKRSSR